MMRIESFSLMRLLHAILTFLGTRLHVSCFTDSEVRKLGIFRLIAFISVIRGATVSARWSHA